ncbi:sugar nucleotide-binding protein [Candidatus Pelagibacter sp.]|nr:sugar nucleotide-binding protein [Candidatus Pelagibacter sp.]
MKKKIIITGGTGRFGEYLKKIKSPHKLFFPNKKELNILKPKSIESYLKAKKANIVIHLAGLSRPMDVHNREIEKSIDLNIIGTANVTKICSKKNVKLIYFSTNYVYPGTKGNYTETDPLLPVNNYAWSKLGGEASVQLYDNSLILRVCMTEKPFVHDKAFANVKTSFMYHEDVSKILFRLLNKKGILNLGGKTKFIFDFAKKDKKNIKKIYLKRKNNLGMPFNSSLNINKLKKILK